MEFYHSFNSFAEYIQREVFIGRMDGVTFQTEAHENGFYTEYLFKITDEDGSHQRDFAHG